MSLLCIGPSHPASLHRRRAEPSVVIEELPPDEEEEPLKPTASSKLSAGNGAHQQAVSASNKTAVPLKPASTAAAGDPATAPKPDPMLPASSSPSVAAAAAAAAPTAAALSSSSDQPQADASRQKAVQQLQASTSGSGAANKQRNGPDADSQQVLQSKVPDQSSLAVTPSSDSRAAASPATAAASADTEGAPLSSQNLPGDAPLSTGRSGHLPSVAHQQADLHANGSGTSAAPQANGHAAKQQQPQQQLQQQQQASKDAQEAVSVAHNVAAAGRGGAPAKARAGNTTGMALAAPRSGKRFAQLGQGRQMTHKAIKPVLCVPSICISSPDLVSL